MPALSKPILFWQPLPTVGRDSDSFIIFTSTIQQLTNTQLQSNSTEPQHQLNTVDNHHCYRDGLPEDISYIRKLLEEYSGISPDEAVPHITAIHTKSLLHPDPYPCITSYRFLFPLIPQHPLYPTILSRLTLSATESTPPQTLLDIGCCFGQELRALAFAGVPPTSLYGADLYSSFIDLGYEFFNDKDRMLNMVAGDIFSETSMKDFEGKMDMICAQAFLHLFSREDQIRACVRLISFLRPYTGEEQYKQVIFGRQAASAKPGKRVRENVEFGREEVFLHDLASFGDLWDEIGVLTGTKWEVEGTMLEDTGGKGIKGIEDVDTARRLLFAVWRIG